MKSNDVLHHYMGAHCEYEWTAGIHQANGITKAHVSLYVMGLKGIKVSLVLRPLSDMTTEEYHEYCRIEMDAITDAKTACEIQSRVFSPLTVIYLLSRGFDLFGLIDSGQAIDATKITENPYK